MRILKYFLMLAFVHGFLLLPLWLCALVAAPFAGGAALTRLRNELRDLHKTIWEGTK